ncbi:MAG: right-handed parallel beta-helix repeat-containing protein [Acidimicrobiia bacterium]|nr:right-handed parallel beta-helix repeat-containing protein [Acidimicrobiia bacterium]
MKSSRSLAAVALAVTLALSGCARSDTVPMVADDGYEFPAELVAAGETASAVTTTTVPSLSEPSEPVKPPPPKAAIEALNAPDPLPLPSSDLLPEVGTLEPFVVTDSGERTLLRDVMVTVSYDPEDGLVVDPAGWWVVNYPLDRIVGAEGRTADEVAMLLTGRPASDLSNYYFYTAPDSRESAPDLPARDGPAPIKVSAAVDLVVDNGNPGAADSNDGSRANPLLTISEAVSRAGPGTTIHVYPGVYRESIVITADGTAAEPITIEGIRGASGSMPVITGNDPFPVGSWTEVDGMRGVYAAEAFADLAGSLTNDGESLVARSTPWELQPGEYVVTSGGQAYVDPRFDGRVKAREGSVHSFGSSQFIWETKLADGGGFVDLGSEFGEEFEGGVFWGSAWVYVERPDEVNDYDWYNSFGFDLQVSGPFRAVGMTGVPLAEQPFRYRVWLDGQLLDANVYASVSNGEAELPHPDPGRGDYGETWHNVVMREGWHHLVFQWDTTSAAEGTEALPVFRFGIPELADKAITVAAEPYRKWRRPQGTPQNYVAEYMVLGPVPSDYDPTVFVRLPDNANPNGITLDIAARSGPVVSILGDHVELHGFNIYGGSQVEGDALVEVGRRGDDVLPDIHVQGAVVEGNYIAGSQYGGIGVVVSGDMAMTPITIHNNWVVDSGAFGIAASGVSDRLTPDTVNDWAPGRTPATVSNNTILGTGWAGYDRMQDVAGIRFERMAASTISYNTIAGDGPGISLRGENYGVRIDGNTITDPYGWGIGVEANPGPNLVANNIVTGLRIGPDWYKGHLLTWDSDQTWIINNTVDGLWSTETGWFGDVGTWGAGGPENFQRIDYWRWEIEDFRRTYVNNLLLGNYLGGIEDYMGNWGESDSYTANYKEVPRPDPFDFLEDGAEKADVRYDFVDRNDGDYRLRNRSELNTLGATSLTVRLAALDLLGLPRFIGETTSVGAYRNAPVVSAGSSVIEVLYTDGSVVRIEG